MIGGITARNAVSRSSTVLRVRALRKRMTFPRTGINPSEKE